jgi:hypothetical protein
MSGIHRLDKEDPFLKASAIFCLLGTNRLKFLHGGTMDMNSSMDKLQQIR